MPSFIQKSQSVDADLHVTDFSNKTIESAHAIDVYDSTGRKEVLKVQLHFNKALIKILSEEDNQNRSRQRVLQNASTDWLMFAGVALKNTNALVLGFAPHGNTVNGYIHVSDTTVFSEKFQLDDREKSFSFLRRYFHGCDVDVTKEKLLTMASTYNLTNGSGIMEIIAMRRNLANPTGEKIPIAYDFIPTYIHSMPEEEHTLAIGYMYRNAMPVIVEIVDGNSYVFFPRAESLYRPPMKASTNIRQTKHIF